MSILDRHLEMLEKRNPHFTVPLSNGLTFVFRRLGSFLEYKKLMKQGWGVVERYEAGHKIEAEEKHRPEGSTQGEWVQLLESAYFFAEIHIGFIEDGELVEEKVAPAGFLALAAKDGQTFRRLFDALNLVTDVELLEPEELDAFGLKKKQAGDSITSLPEETSGESTPTS